MPGFCCATAVCQHWPLGSLAQSKALQTLSRERLRSAPRPHFPEDCPLSAPPSTRFTQHLGFCRPALPARFDGTALLQHRAGKKVFGHWKDKQAKAQKDKTARPSAFCLSGRSLRRAQATWLPRHADENLREMDGTKKTRLSLAAPAR